jgi:hypothetical protein
VEHLHRVLEPDDVAVGHEQRGDVVGEQLVPKRPADVAGVPVALELDGDDPSARGAG